MSDLDVTAIGARCAGSPTAMSGEGSDVHLSQDDGHLRIEVTDGCGFQPDTRTAGTGIVALADRLEALDGHLDVDSQLEGGTTVTARLPARPRTPPIG